MTLIKQEDAIEAMQNEIQDFEKDCMHGEDDENFEHDIGFVAGLHRAKHIIRELPSTDSEWIPITTSEPTTSDHVLVTYKWDEDDYETSELDYWVTKCAAEEGNKQCQMFIDHVIAWSFMPQPYKER